MEFGEERPELVVAVVEPLETTQIYTRPTAEDRTRAVDLLPIDE